MKKNHTEQEIMEELGRFKSLAISNSEKDKQINREIERIVASIRNSTPENRRNVINQARLELRKLTIVGPCRSNIPPAQNKEVIFSGASVSKSAQEQKEGVDNSHILQNGMELLILVRQKAIRPAQESARDPKSPKF